MREVIERFVCDVDREPAKVQGLLFFWPETGQTFRIDPCSQHYDAINAALAPFVGQAMVQPASARLTLERTHDTNRELPAGVTWQVAKNSQYGKGGTGMAHATRDHIRSRCGLITDATRWAESGPGQPRAAGPGDQQCKQCLVGLAMDDREARNPVVSLDLLNQARAAIEQHRRRYPATPIMNRDQLGRNLRISNSSAGGLLRLIRAEEKDAATAIETPGMEVT